MAFPGDPLPILVELLIDGVWQDITSTDDVLARGAVSITRGTADEGQRADPARCTFSVNNKTGRYSPRNPMSDLYGKIGRNTLTRVSVLTGDSYVDMPGTAGAFVFAPDASALGITADIDVRVDVTLPNWPGAYGLVSKYRTTSNQRSWSLHANQGFLEFYWSPDGTLASRIFARSTARVAPPPSGRLALRVTLDVNNGASGNTATFYTSDSMSGTWTQLGSAVVTPGTTSIFDSTAPVEINNLLIVDADPLVGHVHALELRSGIAGTVVANPSFTGQTPGVTSFADTASSPNTWTTAGGAEITNRRVRFLGEISEWPSRWNLSDRDVWVPVQASGILRRLGQGQSPLQSALRRGLSSLSTNPPVAYWPCEDLAASTRLASAISGAEPLFLTGSPEVASFDGFAASGPIPQLRLSRWDGAIPLYGSTNQVQMRWIQFVPAGGSIPDGTVIASVYTTGSGSWDLCYGTGGTLRLIARDINGVSIMDTGNVGFAVDGKLLRVSLELQQDGADIDWNMLTLEVGQSTGFTFAGTMTNRTVGRATRVVINPGSVLDDVAVGHISVQTAITSLYELASELNAYQGETAGMRLARLCDEERIPLEMRGFADATTPMGPQRVGTLLDLLSEAADVDGGILGESRAQLGLAYATRAALYNQAPMLELDYEARHLAPPLEPTEDDQNVRNDWTVSRVGGSSARYQQREGPLSVEAPPAGVGRYDDTATLNVATDEQLQNIAAWRVHLGTWDEARYPTITVSLNSNPQLIEDVAAVDSGQRATIDNPPPWLPPEPIDLLVRGYSETMSAFVWRWTANSTPAGPYRVAVYEQSRYDTAGSELAAGVNSTAGTLSVLTTLGPIWITDASHFPFDIRMGGEQIRVTGITGSTTTQSFAVTRSVNGIVKSHSGGAAISLWDPAIYAL